MHHVRYVKIGFSLGLKFRDVISIKAKDGGSGRISRNTILLKMHELITVYISLKDYTYGSKDFGKYNVKNLLDPRIYGGAINNHFNCL